MKEKKFDVLFWFQLFLIIISMLLAIYVRVRGNYSLQPFVLIMVSVLLIIAGLQEYKRVKTMFSLFLFILLICISSYIIYSAVFSTWFRILGLNYIDQTAILGVFVDYWRGRGLTVFLKILGFAGMLLIVGVNGFEIESLFALIFIPLFFSGKNWY